MGGHSEIPGGFGATGGPNDLWHQVMHIISKSYLVLAVGWGQMPGLRRRFDKLEFREASWVNTLLNMFGSVC